MGDEAEALSEQYVDEEVYRDLQEIERERMHRRYNDNAQSPRGCTIRCACCGRRIKKANYQTQFCSNRGRGNCKDIFWNTVNPKRRR